MGKVITKRINGMGWTVKVSLVLICTMLLSVFMYQGLFKPKGSQADVTVLQAWSMIYNNAAFPAAGITYAVPAGPNRKLVVAVSSTISAAAAQTCTVTYGGQTLTAGPADPTTPTQLQHTYLFYLDEAGIAAATSTTMNVTISGGVSIFNYVYAAVYSGASASVSSPLNYTSANSDSSAPTFAPSTLTIAAGDLAVEMVNLSRSGNTSARTISTYASGWTQALGNTTATSTAVAAYAAVNAPLGNSTITQSAHTASGTARISMSAMTLNKAANSAVITSVAPTSIFRGDPVQTLVINGTGFTGATAVSFTPVDANITLGTVTVVNDTQITVPITIGAAAVTGNRTITVTTPVGTSAAVLPNFVASNLPAPTVSSIAANQLGQGATSKSVTITGTNFQSGATVAISNGSSSVTVVGTPTFVNDTTLTANLTVSSSQTTGLYNVTVTNTDTKNSGTTGNGLFTVTAAPATIAASPYGITPGTTTNVTFTGSGYYTGATVALGNGTGVTINGAASVNNANSLTQNITVAADAQVGTRTFTCTNTHFGTTTSSSIMQVITPATLAITSVAPNTVGQGSSNVSVHIYGANFSPAPNATTVAFSSSRVTLNSVTFVDSMHLIANITTSTSSAQASNITVTNPAGSANPGTFTATGAFYVTNMPTITSVSPNQGLRGNPFDLIFTGTNFQSGASVAFTTGSGVAVSNIVFGSPTSITAHIVIDPAATPGIQTVMLTNPDLGDNTITFNVTTPTSPTLTSMTPATIGQGSTLDVDLFGANFNSGVTAGSLSFGSGITVNSVAFVDATHLRANITLSTSATAGAHIVTVTNPNGEAGVASILTVTARPGTISLSPSTGTLGTAFNIGITGTGFLAGPGLGVTVSGNGVTVGSTTLNSATSATANNVTINADYNVAPVGARTLTFSNGDYGVRTATFTVRGLAPAVSSAAPASLRQGAAAQDLLISGTNFYPGATASFSGAGITVNSTTFVDPSTVRANVTVNGDAATGTSNITITNSDSQNATGTGIFTVAPAPTITSISPLTGGQGSTLDVTINGTDFDGGAVALFSDAGVTVNSTSYVSSSQVKANITIAADALRTPRYLTVTNPEGSRAIGGTFTITLPQPTTTGALSFYNVTAGSITVQAAYTNDGDNDNTCIIRWGTAPGSYPNTAAAVKGAGSFTATLSGLPGGNDGEGKPYYFQATFSDGDGVIGTNPLAGVQSTRGSTLMHNSLNLSSGKWPQAWGTAEGKYGAFKCATCHNENTTNSRMVATSIQSPSLENWSSSGTGSTLNVVLRNVMGTDSAHVSSTNVCEACHSRTNHHRYNNPAANHEGNADCLNCHSHGEGFIPSCMTCHSTPQGAGGNRRQVIGSGGDFFTNMSAHNTFSGSSTQYCTVCHDGTAHETFNDGVSVKLKNADGGASAVYDGTPATAAAVKDICISCHDSNGAGSLGANALTPFSVSGDTASPANIGQYWPATNGAHSTNMYCFNCHGNSKGVDGSTTNPKYNGHASGNKHVLQDAGYDIMNPNNYCFGCHNASSTDPNKSSKNIAAQMALTNKHTTAKCFDCHGDENNSLDSMHSLKAGSQTPGSGIIANNISNATGRSMTWSGTSWGGAPASANLASNTVTAEYQVCFKCHAATGTGTTPDVPSAGTAAASLTNLALEFNPNNSSRHPVGSALRSADRLSSSEMAGGWAPGSVMTCSDCHATDTAASKGPHGSSVKWMLTGQNKAWPYTNTAGNGGSSGSLYTVGNASGNSTGSNGLFCKNCHTVTSTNAAHIYAEGSPGEHSSTDSVFACASCHIRVPHGGKISRLLVTTGAPARYTTTGNGGTINFDAWGTATQNIKGTPSFSGTNFNSQCSEHNSGGVGGEHW